MLTLLKNARHLPCLPDARIPPGCGLACICRYVYATSIHWAILSLLSYSTSVMPIWRQFLQYSAEYYNYHPGPDCWKSDCWMDCMFSMPLLVPLFMQLQLIAVLLLFTCPFLDTAETVRCAITSPMNLADKRMLACRSRSPYIDVCSLV